MKNSANSKTPKHTPKRSKAGEIDKAAIQTPSPQQHSDYGAEHFELRAPKSDLPKKQPKTN